eukprot:CAMPEP_0194527238 /NCGR_PEP_ID=MMETSP0253-20130528/63283_1 /TAXON_ID=2966 /ORGANISM="Noctiluca scintillans" /LENGTH=56 /DNA_ID=CAMNT_0039372149 /DNA_START=130 /DNA_END=297 /DNA_ORIENTATION=+
MWRSIKPPLHKDGFLHLEGDVDETHQKDRPLKSRISGTLPYFILEPPLTVRLRQFV